MAEFLLDRIIGERGFSVADVSRMSGIGRSTLDDVRRKGGGRRETLDKIAEALGITYEDLFSQDVQNPIPSSAVTPVQWNRAELLRNAEMYKAEGDDVLYNRLMSSVMKVGIEVEGLLDDADTLYKQGHSDRAFEKYASAMMSVRPRHIGRLRQSVLYIFDLCEQTHNPQPIIDLFGKVKEKSYHDCELLYRIGAFFARNRLDQQLICDCLDIADSLSE
ncbi:hypothetical protein FACS1894202_14520 [Clostridia bacterium]|nr:hypothetical protein FACS1894202_14520 [Clostridia bacterium]